ncbi:hypothetical protein ACFCWY_08750 [Streptomyces sp. NPDC056362]|uniref:hypothetical protein n=1 Tax=unclassified Streptomyces TaxID=2593676 RepID=UPI0035D6426A
MNFLRREPCRIRSLVDVGLECQRPQRHRGPHRASPNGSEPMHRSWTGFTYEWRPGTAWRRPYHSLDMFVGLGLGVAYVLVLMTYYSLSSALTAAVVLMVLQTNQPHFVDFGRFSAGIWPEPRGEGSVSFFAIGRGIDGCRRAPHRSGLWISLGGVTVSVFAVLTRDEWAQWTAYKAQGSPFAPENIRRALEEGDQ